MNGGGSLGILILSERGTGDRIIRVQERLVKINYGVTTLVLLLMGGRAIRVRTNGQLDLMYMSMVPCMILFYQPDHGLT